MSTELTSELTHFNLVIRLSKVKQLALRFVSLFESPAVPAVPCELLWNAVLWVWSCAEHSETSLFSQQLLQSHCIITWHRNQAGTRLSGVAFFLLMVVWWGETCCAPNSLELESRLIMPIGARLDHGPRKGTTRDLYVLRNWVLFCCFLFSPTSPHWSLIFPACLSVMCRWV